MKKPTSRPKLVKPREYPLPRPPVPHDDDEWPDHQWGRLRKHRGRPMDIGDLIDLLAQGLENEAEFTRKAFRTITRKLETLMAKVDELNAKVDELQAKVDDTQARIAAGVQTLKDTIQTLQDQIEAGNTDGITGPQADAIVVKLQGAIDDLGTTEV